MALAWLLSESLGMLPVGWYRTVLVAYVVFNVSYLWVRKDVQYQQRAAPTGQLIQILRSRSPQPVQVLDFPENPWTAKLTTRLVAGWKPEMLRVNEPDNACTGCLTLRWDLTQRRYIVSDR